MITAENPRASYVAGGGVGDVNFAYSYKIFQSTDLLVYDDDILQTLNVHYTVSMNPDGIGGTVTFITAPVAASVIDIVRSIPLTQNMDLVEGARMPAETLEATFDKQTMTLQDMSSKLDALLAGGGILPIDPTVVWSMLDHGGYTAKPDDLITKSPWVDVRAYGAKVDNITDDTTAIQLAIDSLGTAPGAIFLPGICKTTDTLTFSNHRQGFIGLSPKLSGINFVPASGGKQIIKFQKSTAVMIVQNFVKNISLESSDTVLNKIGIELVDVSYFMSENLVINALNGDSSEGLRVKGRDTSYFNNLEISADIPIHVMKNPNTATSDMTGFNYHKTYFIATGTNPHILIDSNCWVCGLNITGTNVWAFGKYGIYMVDTETTLAMYNWVIDGVIWEQVSEVGGYFAYISANTQITNLTFRNIFAGPSGSMNANGYYFRKANHVVLDNCNYAGTGIPFNLDDTVYPFELRNFYSPTGGSASVTSNLRPSHYITSETGVVNYALFTDPSALYGNFYLNKIQTLADSATPSVSNGNVFLTGGTTTITNFTGAWPGQEIKIISEHAITITDGTNIFLAGSANFVMGATDTLTLIQKADGKWYELSRSDN